MVMESAFSFELGCPVFRGQIFRILKSSNMAGNYFLLVTDEGAFSIREKICRSLVEMFSDVIRQVISWEVPAFQNLVVCPEVSP
jgi:hypothetical protein